MRRTRARIATVAVLTAGFVAGLAVEASAHPLGNFTVNHYDGLQIYADHIVDHAVVDSAEIPALQERGHVDADHDGVIDDIERSLYAARICASLRTAVRTTVDGVPINWRVV